MKKLSVFLILGGLLVFGFMLTKNFQVANALCDPNTNSESGPSIETFTLSANSAQTVLTATVVYYKGGRCVGGGANVTFNGHSTFSIPNASLINSSVMPAEDCSTEGGRKCTDVSTYDISGISVNNTYPGSVVVDSTMGSPNSDSRSANFVINNRCANVCSNASPTYAVPANGFCAVSGCSTVTIPSALSACNSSGCKQVACDSGYTLDMSGGQPVCTQNFPTTYSCIGSTPANANFCSGSSGNLTQDVNKALYPSCGTNQCAYVCATGYSYDAGDGTSSNPPHCVATQPYSCTGPVPDQNSTLCAGSDSGLLQGDVSRNLQSSCDVVYGGGPERCSYTCNSPYRYYQDPTTGIRSCVGTIVTPGV